MEFFLRARVGQKLFPQHFLSENVISSEQNNLCGNMSVMTKQEGGPVNDSFSGIKTFYFEAFLNIISMVLLLIIIIF